MKEENNNATKKEKIIELDYSTCKTIKINATFSWPYFFMNILATIIASFGLLANSPAVVIGAMIIALLLGPIIGMGLGVADQDKKLLNKSFLTLLYGCFGVFMSSFIIGAINKDIPFGSEILNRTSPNLFDLMIALASGIAGAYATIKPNLNTGIVGVAISTALVPPLSSAGILIARGEYTLGIGALLLVFTNMVAIQFATSAMLWIDSAQNESKKESFNLKTFIKRNSLSITIIIILAILLTNNLHTVVSKQVFESSTNSILEKHISEIDGNYLAETRFDKISNKTVVIAVIRGPKNLTMEEIANLETKLPRSPDNSEVHLRIRYVNTFTLDKYGIIYKESSSKKSIN